MTSQAVLKDCVWCVRAVKTVYLTWIRQFLRILLSVLQIFTLLT